MNIRIDTVRHSGTPVARDTPIVFVVDDDVSVRESLESMIRVAGWQPRTFASAGEFLACPRVLTPSCLILDVTLPDFDGLELQNLIANRTEMPIIFITGHADVPMTVRAMKAGAIEFLTKPFRDQDLLDAVQLGLERDRARREQEAPIAELRRRFEKLTPREQEVMTFVTAGLMNKQIAGKIGVSEITVKVHRGNVMRKTGARSLAELVRMADLLGLRRTKA